MSALLFVLFTACAADRCQEVELPFDGTVFECILHSQFVLAAWAADHPGWVVNGRYRCREGRDA